MDSKNKWSGKNASFNYKFFIDRINKYTKRGVHVLSNKDLYKIFEIAYSPDMLNFKNPSLLHGDLTGGNIIIPSKPTKTKQLYLFDPGELIGGDPMSDLGYTQTSRRIPEFRKGIYEGYTAEKKLSFEEETRFKKWQLLRQCVITYRAKCLKSKKSELNVEYLKKLLNDFDK